MSKYFKPENKMFFKMYLREKEFWEDSIIKKRIGKMTYMVLGQRWEHK